MDSSNQDQSDSLILGNCLSCQGLVRVPAKAPSDSMVRCPHCSESYRLAQIIDQAVPQLEIVGETQSEPVIPRVDRVLINERETFVVPSQLSKGAKRSRRRRSSSSDSSNDRRGSGNGSQNGEQDGEVWRKKSKSDGRNDSVPSLTTSTRRPKPPSQNPTAEMAKVVIGGLLAIPIAYMLVLWVFNQDPINLAPKINQVAPFLVPAALKDASGEPAETSDVLPGEPNVETQGTPTLDPNRALDPGVDESDSSIDP